MKVSPQPRVSALLRIFAGTCAWLWLAGIAVRGLGCFCLCAGREGACAAHASRVHEHDVVSAQEQGHTHAAEAHQHATASHHGDGEAPQGHCGRNGCEEQCRCSATIQGVVQLPPAVVIPEPVSQPVPNIFLLCAARAHVFAAAKCDPVRPASPRQWVFTPEVCLGPAFRSHAPPASV